MKKIMILCLSLVVTYSCAQSSEKLSRATALKILKENYRELCTSDVVDYFSSTPSSSKYKSYKSYFANLEKMGLVNLQKLNFKNGRVGLKITATQLGKQKYDAGPGYMSMKAAITEFDPQEIIGISHYNGNKAEVLFKGQIAPTIFYGITKSKRHCKTAIEVERKVTFTRYDSGWRMD